MTFNEWNKEKIRLTGAVTRARTAVTKAGSLAEKIERKAEVICHEENLRKHKLNFHDLTNPPAN